MLPSIAGFLLSQAVAADGMALQKMLSFFLVHRLAAALVAWSKAASIIAHSFDFKSFRHIPHVANLKT